MLYYINLRLFMSIIILFIEGSCDLYMYFKKVDIF